MGTRFVACAVHVFKWWVRGDMTAYMGITTCIDCNQRALGVEQSSQQLQESSHVKWASCKCCDYATASSEWTAELPWT